MRFRGRGARFLSMRCYPLLRVGTAERILRGEGSVAGVEPLSQLGLTPHLASGTDCVKRAEDEGFEPSDAVLGTSTP